MMPMFAQLPGTDEAIKEAARVGWEAVVLVIIVCSGLVSFGWLIKMLMQRHLAVEERILAEAKDRETRLAQRVTTLEDMVQTKLFQLIEKNSEAMGRMLAAADAICRAADSMMTTMDKFSTILEARPCLFEDLKRRKLIEIADHDAK